VQRAQRPGGERQATAAGQEGPRSPPAPVLAGGRTSVSPPDRGAHAAATDDDGEGDGAKTLTPTELYFFSPLID